MLDKNWIKNKLTSLLRSDNVHSLYDIQMNEVKDGKKSADHKIGEVIYDSEQVSPCDDESHVLRVKMQKEGTYEIRGVKHDLWLNVIHADEDEKDYESHSSSNYRSRICYVLTPSEEFVENVPWTSSLWYHPMIIRELKLIMTDSDALLHWTNCGRDLKDWAKYWYAES